MKINCVLFLFLILFTSVYSQEGFVFDKDVRKVQIPFTLINNLIVIPIKVNGVTLNFLLDSGVEETILFGLEDNPDLNFYNSQKISLRGLGSEDNIEGLKTTNNILELDGLRAKEQLIYVVLDPYFNLSKQIGIPVNGIIGYHFFKDNLIDIEYAREKIIVYQNNIKNTKKVQRKFYRVPITIEEFKPYLMGFTEIDTIKVSTKMLLDVGNSDSVWLFQDLSEYIKVPIKNFDDYLGKGFSGDIEGKRAKIKSFSFDKFIFKSPIVGFPDSTSIKSVRMVKDRIGSVGGGILKRFSVVFDYKNEHLYLKKNSRYNEPFTYNKSGIELNNIGLKWIKETVKLETVPQSTYADFNSSSVKVTNDFNYKFKLKPVYQIVNIRKNSPAFKSGLRVGDVIVSINNLTIINQSLKKINEMFKPEDNKWFYVEIERKGKALKFAFELVDVL